MSEKLEFIYVLSHIRPLPDGEEEDRLIGIYSSKERTELRKRQLQGQPPFSDAPNEFYLSRGKIGAEEEGWPEGYITVY
ncbi:MAG: hypothetical protein JKX93_13980 [Rhizobiaceae bacterium]|nr:hypothetical protein [Rhizobiaceae bacterium]